MFLFMVVLLLVFWPAEAFSNNRPPKHSTAINAKAKNDFFLISVSSFKNQIEFSRGKRKRI